MKAELHPVTGNSGRCGENNYEGGGVNKLTFFLKPEADCVLEIAPRNAIMLGVRLEMTVEAFFDHGGVTVFVHNMASLLEVHYADIRVVAAYSGSDVNHGHRRELQSALDDLGTLIVEFEVWNGELEEDHELEEQKKFGKEVEETFISLMTTITEFMDSPVLNAVADGNPIETPVGKERAANGGDSGFTFDFGLFAGEEKKEPNIDVEIQHQPTVTVDAYSQISRSITWGHVIVVISATFGLILMSICIYKTCCKQRDKVVKEVTDLTPLEKVRAEKGKLEAVSLES